MASLPHVFLSPMLHASAFCFLRAYRRAFSRKKAAQRAKRMAGQGRAAPQSSGPPWESRDTKPRTAGTGPYAYRQRFAGRFCLRD